MPSSQRSMNLTEAIAKYVVEAALPGAEMIHNPVQSHGEYDFDLRSDGAVAAVEVTASADQLQKQISAQICNEKRGGAVVEARKCKKSWMIFPTKNADMRKIRSRLDEYLFVLEQAGIESFSATYGVVCSRPQEQVCALPSMPQSVRAICSDLEIDSGSTIPTSEAPKIFIEPPGGEGGWPRTSDAIEAGEREAWKCDNRKKLGAAQTKERHFVVCIDVMNSLPKDALTHFEPPSALPNLPEEITHIWLIGYSGEACKFIVWKASTKEPWRSFTVCLEPEVFERIQEWQ